MVLFFVLTLVCVLSTVGAYFFGRAKGGAFALGLLAKWGLPSKLGDNGDVESFGIERLSTGDVDVLWRHHIKRLENEKAAKKAAEEAKIKAVIRDSRAEIKPIVDERLVEKGLLTKPEWQFDPDQNMWVYGSSPTPTPTQLKRARKAKKATKKRGGK